MAPLPIPDGPPGGAFESAWVDAGAQARGILSGKLVCTAAAESGARHHCVAAAH